MRGTLDNVTDSKGKATSYNYNSNNDRLESVCKGTGDLGGETEITAQNNYSYENDRIKTITHNGFTYTFEYDEFGNVKAVYAGGHQLIYNNYETKNVVDKDGITQTVNTGKLIDSSYLHNPDKDKKTIISWDYDNLDRVKTEKYNNQERYKFEYDGSGNLGYQEDLVNGVDYRYLYDFAHRLAMITGLDNTPLDKTDDALKLIDTATSFEYDLNNNLSKLKVMLTQQDICRIRTIKIPI